MSEKLYKVVEAVDLLDGDSPIPERYLVFMDSDGNQIKEFFPKDRMTLFFNDELYDWYGRKVKPKSGITKILSHFGCVDCNGGMGEYHETFVVRRKSGRLSIAELDVFPQFPYENPLKRTDQNWAKIYTLPFVKPSLYTMDWSFKNFQEPPTTHSCIHGINKYLQENFGCTCKICTDIKFFDSNVHKDRVVFVKTQHLDGEEILHHYIVDTEEEIRYIAKYGSKIAYGSRYVEGELTFSEDGKMSAFLTLGNRKVRISTTADIFYRTYEDVHRICWYIEPGS